MLIGGVHGRIDAKVDADSISHQRLSIERLADCDGVGSVEEGNNDALERFQRRPCVNFGVCVDSLSDLCEGGGLEDLRCKEILGRVSGACKEGSKANSR